MVNGGPAQRLGRHRWRQRHLVPTLRWHTVSGASPLAAPSTAASQRQRVVGRIEGLRRLARGDARPRSRGGPASRRAPTQVLPTSVPVPTTATSRRGRAHRLTSAARGQRAIAASVRQGGRRSTANSRDDLRKSSVTTPPLPSLDGRRPARRAADPRPRRVWAADSVTRSRLVPTGTVGGRMAGTHSPRASSAAEASSAASSLPRTTGMIGLGWSGGARPASASRSIRAARRAVKAAPSAERTIRSAASAAAASAGVSAVEKM